MRQFRGVQGSILLFGILIHGCTKDAPSGPPEPFDAKVRSYFGEDVCAIVEGAEKVEVQRIDPVEWRNSPRIVALTGDPVVPSWDWIRRLQAVLGNSQSYPGQLQKKCRPLPGLRILFIKGAERVELLICFDCNMLSLARAGGIHWDDFDPARGELVQLAKEIFPRDPVIQGLKTSPR